MFRAYEIDKKEEKNRQFKGGKKKKLRKGRNMFRVLFAHAFFQNLNCNS